MPYLNVQPDAYSRAITEPVFLQNVRSSYTGSYNVLDALWWSNNPLEPSPAGVPSPASRLLDLRRRVFSETGDSVGDARTSEELHALNDELTFERHAIATAIQQALSGRPAEPALEQPFQQAISAENVAGQNHEPGESSSLPEEPPRTHRFLVGASIAGALLLGIPIGMQLSSSSETSTPSSTPSPAPPPAAVLIFEQPQAPEDVPLLSTPPTLQSETFRALVPSSADSSIAGLYVARNTSNSVCLVVIHPEDQYVSSCSIESEFPATGIRLHWLDSVDYAGEDGGVFASPIDMSAVWKPDGTFEMGGNGREAQN